MGAPSSALISTPPGLFAEKCKRGREMGRNNEPSPCPFWRRSQLLTKQNKASFRLDWKGLHLCGGGALSHVVLRDRASPSLRLVVVCANTPAVPSQDAGGNLRGWETSINACMRRKTQKGGREAMQESRALYERYLH